MNKCHVPITWVNDQAPAINDTNLNQYDGELDTLDDRIITLDSTKAAQSDLLLAFKDVSLNSSTGVITFTLFNNTQKTIDTLLEKIAINFDYDDDPTSPHYQNLIIELEDGTYKYIDMSALITEYEFVNSSTVAFTVANDGSVSASVIDGSITSSKLDPAFAVTISDAEANGLRSEGYANGTQNGTPVTSGSPYFENNAKYWKEQAQAIAQQSLSSLSDVNITTPSDGDVLAYNPTSQEWENKTLALNSLSNVEVINPQQGDTLTYDSASGKFKNVSGIFKTFASATDAEIATMVALADAGAIDLYEDCGWRVGQEHQINLASIASSGTYDGVSWSVGESQSAQTVTLVLMHKGLYELVTPVLDKQGQTRNTCSFVVGVKDSLETKGYINSTNTNTGSWDGCARRSWCNGGFREAIPSALRPAFKQFKTITAQTYNGSTNQTSNDYFALAAEKEIVGSAVRSNATEAMALTQFEYYQTASNRIKYINSVASAWWERSPYATSAVDWCGITTVGAASGNGSSYDYGLSPFGCL